MTACQRELRGDDQKKRRTSGEKRRQVTTGRDRVGGDVEQELYPDEAERDEKEPGAGAGGRVGVEHGVHDLARQLTAWSISFALSRFVTHLDDIPDRPTKLRLRRRSNHDAHKARDGKAKGHGV